MTIATSSDAGTAQLNGGCFSAQIEAISGLHPEAGLQLELPNLGQMISGDTIYLNEPFILALNDQKLELNGIENSLMLAA